MRKINTSPLSGMQELLPNEQALFDQLKHGISDVYHRHGFLNIETPIIERSEVIFAKAGGDTEKQIYLVHKTGESADAADQALRFDHTVPLARYVVEHNGQLSFPFQVSQINRNFRGERAQHGRFREFYQCDIDIIGREQLPLAYDAKVIGCVYEALQTFNLPNILVRISNRKILAAFLTALNLSEYSTQISSIIDHAEKVPSEQSKTALHELGLSDQQVNQVSDFMFTHGSYTEVTAQLGKIIGDLAPLQDGLAELKSVTDLLELAGDIRYTIDFMIIRGLDYYTGTVFETILEDYRDIGSIASGGRYDNLCSNFSNQNFPGVGGSIGLTRLFTVFRERQLLDAPAQHSVDYVLLPLSAQEYAATFQLAAQLRKSQHSVDIDFSERKLGDRFNRASQIADFAIVVGANEVASGHYQAKNLTTGELHDVTAQ